jgi:hypothetical protein
VVFLPDTALLVPGAAGRADPAAALREAAVAAVREASGVTDGPVLVVAPARRARTIAHPVATGLGAAGPAARADVPASVALVLLRAAGVSAPVDVVEVPRAAAEVPVLPPGAALLVVVGSPSARQGVDAPLAEDPRAAEVDAALLAGLARGPAALASALVALGPRDAAALAVSGWAPWSAALAALGDEPVRVAAHVPAVVAGAPHCVTAWLPARPENHPEETR